jgi:preprotein translocase subunit SecG
MSTVILTIHLLLALALIIVVLLQRSEGGGLGIGGGGGGIMTGRGAASALAKVTWGLGIAFVCTSLALTVIAARESGAGSVIDRIGTPESDATLPGLPPGTDLLPPVPTTEPGPVPATPPAPSGPAMPPAQE